MDIICGIVLVKNEIRIKCMISKTTIVLSDPATNTNGGCYKNNLDILYVP